MGNTPSQADAGVEERQPPNSAATYRTRHEEADHAHANAHGDEPPLRDPNRAGDPSAKDKKKKRKGEKRRKKGSKLDSGHSKEHSKEEESARTLLEMKGASASNPVFEEEDNSTCLEKAIAGNDEDDASAQIRLPTTSKEHRTKTHSSRKRKKGHRSKLIRVEECERGAPADTREDSALYQNDVLSTMYTSDPTHYSSKQNTMQDVTSSQGYETVAPYAEHTLSTSTPPYGPDSHSSPLHSTAFQQQSQGTSYSRREKRKSTATEDANELGSVATTYGRGSKRRKIIDAVAAAAEAHSAALADAASAANALIDPALTGQPPQWAIVDGKTTYIGVTDNNTLGQPSQGVADLHRKSGAKKKRRLPVDDIADGATTSGKLRKKARKSGQPEDLIALNESMLSVGSHNGPITKTKGGPFTEGEEAMLKQFMETYRAEHDMTEFELNARVWAERRYARDDFWDLVSAVLPHRPRQSVYKFCRRQFHNFPKRGQWTRDEDDELAVAAKEHPQQWKIIGSMLNRMPEDCRDRWRNYLKCGEARKKDVWTEHEENLLRHLVQESMDALQKDEGIGISPTENIMSDEDVEKRMALINWTIISEKMGGTRSRIQCSYKWKKMQKWAAKEQERLGRSQLNELRELVSHAEPEQKKTWRVKKAEGNFLKMLPGDKLELLKALKDSGTYEEKNIPWKLVGSPEYCKTWTLTDRKTAFKFLKAGVPNHQDKTLQDIVDELLAELHGLPPETLTMQYVPPKASLKRKSRTKSDKIVTEDTGGGNLGYHHESSNGGYDDQESEYQHRLSLEERRYLAGDVDDRMAQQVQLLRSV